MPKILIIALLVILAGFYITTQESSEPATVTTPAQPAPAQTSPKTTKPAEVVFTQYLQAGMVAAMSAAQCGYSDVGYAHYTPLQAAQNVVQQMNASVATVPGEPAARGTHISYALDKPTQAWQIVVIADEAQQQLHFYAYGTNLAKPLSKQSMPCRG